MSARNLLTEWAWLLLDSLAAAGVRDVVLSPGSRSTPFVVAAERHPQLACHTVVDERVAAFFALGQGRASGRPSLLLCTSGTAAAHYLPAVVEAGAAAVPLLVLTADRPGERLDCGAPQTVDQVKLYGDHARHFVELGAPDSHPQALRGLRRIAAQAVLRSRWPVAGAVHLNARARKPLEPCQAATESEAALTARVRDLVAMPNPVAAAPRRLPDADALREVVAACRERERGLIVLGPARLSQRRLRRPIFELARRTGYALFAEATSQLRFAAPLPAGVVLLDAFSPLLECERFRREQRPDVILQIGRAPMSGGWEPFLAAHPACRRFVLSEDLWHDPTSSADLLLFADLGESLAALDEDLDLERGAGRWAQELARWNRRAVDITEAACRAAEPAGEARAGLVPGSGEGELEEGTVARLVVESLPDGSLLGLGNSLPIRQVERYAAGLTRDLSVWSQRGANGIDGLVSGFAGSLSALPPELRPPAGVLLIGDVSLLHDLGGLAAARQVAALPFVVVVVHNNGGRIFEELPVAAAENVPQAMLDRWLTPHGLDLAQAARLFGLRHQTVRSGGELRTALAAALERPGACLMQVQVASSGAQRQNRRLRSALDGLAASGRSAAASTAGSIRP